MIITHQDRMPFVHIPKCAGTTVRRVVRQLDDTKVMFENRVDQHPHLGRLGYVHIPFLVLRSAFPTVYEPLASYSSFAVARDHRERFASSPPQHLKMYTTARVEDFSRSELKAGIDDAIGFLPERRKAKVIPPEYIHRQPQRDYVCLDGQRVISNRRTPCQLAGVGSFGDVEVHTGVVSRAPEGSSGHRANQTRTHRCNLTRLFVRNTRPVCKRARRFIPSGAAWLAKRLLYVPLHARMADVLMSASVCEFVAHFDAEDIWLFQEVSSEAGEAGSCNG